MQGGVQQQQPATPAYAPPTALPIMVPAPTALPIFVAIPSSIPSPLGSSSASGSCAKDAACFDANYECTGCCSAGLAKNGVGCWDTTYTIQRCCAGSGSSTVHTPPALAPTGYSPLYTLPAYMPPVYVSPVSTQSSSCAKDAACFDANYECTGCCSTGLAKNGALCWDTTYTIQRCCLQLPQAGQTQSAVAYTPSAYIPTASTPAIYTSPMYTPPVYVPPVSAPSCAKDMACFDANFECTGCCSTGLAKNGAGCWDITYTIQRCCLQPLSASAQPPAYTPPVYAPPVNMPPAFTFPSYVGASCADTNSNCLVWSQLGECSGTASAFVQSQCCASCGGG